MPIYIEERLTATNLKMKVISFLFCNSNSNNRKVSFYLIPNPRSHIQVNITGVFVFPVIFRFRR